MALDAPKGTDGLSAAQRVRVVREDRTVRHEQYEQLEAIRGN